jgi:ABC-type uncharacterized transport system YnjBCD ATPase subunit
MCIEVILAIVEQNQSRGSLFSWVAMLLAQRNTCTGDWQVQQMPLQEIPPQNTQ